MSSQMLYSLDCNTAGLTTADPEILWFGQPASFEAMIHPDFDMTHVFLFTLFLQITT